MSFNAFLQIYSCWLTYTNEKTCKLTMIQTEMLAHASRISGVDPACGFLVISEFLNGHFSFEHDKAVLIWAFVAMSSVFL